MPLAPETRLGVLKLSRGQHLLRVAPAEADGQRIYVGFKNEDPLVVASSAATTLRALLETVCLSPT